MLLNCMALLLDNISVVVVVIVVSGGGTIRQSYAGEKKEVCAVAVPFRISMFQKEQYHTSRVLSLTHYTTHYTTLHNTLHTSTQTLALTV